MRARRRRVGGSGLTKGGNPGESQKARRKRLYGQQEGICHQGWGCGRELPLSSLDEAHLSNLGMGASRHNPNDERNSRTVLLCRPCHQNQEKVVRAAHAAWKAGVCDWVEPRPDNAWEVWAQAEKWLEHKKSPPPSEKGDGPGEGVDSP